MDSSALVDSDSAAAAEAVTAAQSREAELVGAVLNNPNDIYALLRLGTFLTEQNRDRDAAAVYRQLLSDHPNNGLALVKLGSILHEYPAFQDEAMELLQKAISLNASATDAYRPLAWTLDQLGRRDDAIAVLRAWCAIAPGEPTASHLLAAYSDEAVPERAADAFVEKTFDRAAARFDVHLRDALQYRGPEVLSAHLDGLLPSAARGTLDVLDMGCGTGLCAPLLRPWARHLTGVDLSSGMLAKARDAGGYDALEVVELTAYLNATVQSGGRFDVLFAADTLVYFGRLDGLFAQAFTVLNAGGWLAFTVERQIATGAGGTPRDLLLDITGRYKHSEQYIQNALSAAGFETPKIIQAQVRLESGAPEIALVVAARKPG